MAVERMTKQRKAIYQNLASRHDHPTAQQLHQDLLKTYPNISLATVYRNLHLLAEIGVIRVIHGETIDHFDADMHPHYHIMCQCCGDISDFFIPPIKEIEKVASDYATAQISGYTLVFYGICPKCAEQQNSES